MGLVALTGSASGIGLATRRQLEAEGHSVIGIDRNEADVVADLATAQGRASMVSDVTAHSGGHLDGVVACAGVLGGRDNAAAVVAVNFFGALATLDGLRPLLREGSAVAVSSVAATVSPVLSAEVLSACEDEDEAAATAVRTDGMSAYAASKLALARAARRRAVGPDWAGSGHRLNIVTPGLVDTPMTAAHLDAWLSAGAAHPMPRRRAAQPAELAAPICWLLSSAASFCVGSVLVVDGGTEAAVRGADWPAPMA